MTETAAVQQDPTAPARVMLQKLPPSLIGAALLLLQAVIGFLISQQNSSLQSFRMDLDKKVSTEVFEAKMEVITVKYDTIDNRLRSLEGKMDQILSMGVQSHMGGNGK